VIELHTRSLSITSGDLALEGALHLPVETPAAGVVVCHPHPQYGGDMDSPVVLAICRGLVTQGYAALRFNFRGAGASEGSFENGAGERDDVRAALSHLAALPEIDPKRIGLAGYSFGGLMAAEAASGGLRGLAIVSPPIGHADLRVGWGCPALVMAGDRDEFAPEARVRVVARGPGVELRIVTGADHFWWGYEQEIEQTIGDFFSRHLQPS
jgi:hypothetical protein